MSEEEQSEYFSRKVFIFNLLHNFIDYEDIESPVKTIPSSAKWITVIPGKS